MNFNFNRFTGVGLILFLAITRTAILATRFIVIDPGKIRSEFRGKNRIRRNICYFRKKIIQTSTNNAVKHSKGRRGLSLQLGTNINAGYKGNNAVHLFLKFEKYENMKINFKNRFLLFVIIIISKPHKRGCVFSCKHWRTV